MITRQIGSKLCADQLDDFKGWIGGFVKANPDDEWVNIDIKESQEGENGTLNVMLGSPRGKNLNPKPRQMMTFCHHRSWVKCYQGMSSSALVSGLDSCLLGFQASRSAYQVPFCDSLMSMFTHSSSGLAFDKATDPKS